MVWRMVLIFLGDESLFQIDPLGTTRFLPTSVALNPKLLEFREPSDCRI